MLFPIDQKWFISPTGYVGIGTTTPTYNLEVNNRLSGLNGIVLGVKGDCGNAVILALDNTNVVGHDWRFASWGNEAGGGGGILDGKFSIIDNTAGLHRLIIDTNGNVGIGPNTYFPADTLEVNGSFSSGNKYFRIDHPLDPVNKTLRHSCVESSEMMTMYRGNVVLDGSGEAVIEMPDWFEALNRDFSYQLTPIGGPAANLYIAKEIVDGHFTIAGGTRGAKVSWLVSGVRHDAFALAHPLRVVEDKGQARCTLLYPNEQEQSALASIR
jgi:hypothetical protein